MLLVHIYSDDELKSHLVSIVPRFPLLQVDLKPNLEFIVDCPKRLYMYIYTINNTVRIDNMDLLGFVILNCIN